MLGFIIVATTAAFCVISLGLSGNVTQNVCPFVGGLGGTGSTLCASCGIGVASAVFGMLAGGLAIAWFLLTGIGNGL